VAALVLFGSGCIGVVDEGGQEVAGPTVLDCQDGWDPKPPVRDSSREYVNVTIESAGPFKVGVPVPAAAPETTFESWRDNASFDASGDASVSTASSSRGRILVLEGQGDAVLCSHSLQFPYIGNRCCAEAFLDATWTTDPGTTRAQWLDVWVPLGDVTITVEYVALSNWCGRDALFSGTDVGGGWVRLDGEDMAWCE
jgi:hypothetical protein